MNTSPVTSCDRCGRSYRSGVYDVCGTCVSSLRLRAERAERERDEACAVSVKRIFELEEELRTIKSLICKNGETPIAAIVSIASALERAERDTDEALKERDLHLAASVLAARERDEARSAPRVSEFQKIYDRLSDALRLHGVRVLVYPVRPHRGQPNTRWFACVFECYPNHLYGTLGRSHSDFVAGDTQTGTWYVLNGPDPNSPLQEIHAEGETPEEALSKVFDKIDETNWMNHKGVPGATMLMGGTCEPEREQ